LYWLLLNETLQFLRAVELLVRGRLAVDADQARLALLFLDLLCLRILLLFGRLFRCRFLRFLLGWRFLALVDLVVRGVGSDNIEHMDFSFWLFFLFLSLLNLVVHGCFCHEVHQRLLDHRVQLVDNVVPLPR